MLRTSCGEPSDDRPVIAIRSLLRQLRWTLRVIRTRRQIASLIGRRDENALALAAALGALVGKPTPEEQAWIDRIETLRRELSRSRDAVRVVDYGAGGPDMTLSEREMAEGRTDQRIVGDICRGASRPFPWGFLLFRLIRAFGSTRCVELGTSLGISAAYQGAALAQSRRGRLVTIEGAPEVAALARTSLRRLDLDNVTVVAGRFQDRLGDVLSDQRPVDYVFVDGHHDGGATVAYFEQLRPFLARRAVLVFDDISWSAGMRRAWTTITADPAVKIAVDLGTMGVCVVETTPSG